MSKPVSDPRARSESAVERPGSEFDQSAMLHRLPRARIVNRLDYLTDAARGKRVIHIGFADAGCAEMQDRHQTWLHERLAKDASSLVGHAVD